MRSLFAFLSLLFLLAPAAALGGSTYQTTLVPDEADTSPGFSAKGSSIKIVSKGNLRLKGKIKRVVDDTGDRVTTDPKDGNDDYCVEIDLFVAATGNPGTSQICFDVKNGNAKFKHKLGGGPALAGAQKGDAVTVREVRVLDGEGNVIGSGGVALRN
jgi:hypothetical protein